MTKGAGAEEHGARKSREEHVGSGSLPSGLLGSCPWLSLPRAAGVSPPQGTVPGSSPFGCQFDYLAPGWLVPVLHSGVHAPSGKRQAPSCPQSYALTLRSVRPCSSRR